MSGTISACKKLVSKMSPSARKVYRILQAEKQMRVRDIESQIHHSPRMVRRALSNLNDLGLIAKIKGPWWYYYTINR